ncbi:OmpA family protein [Carboxylicivirga caseinilyticus]|uniref:OmpA family protein n=1 Tax=Carboxylicivirga caseinilyticus TaxID=3417572 RepID=UPI003D33157B|nr:OmpA family protein [Marinilabiliaceae bacterium A049]
MIKRIILIFAISFIAITLKAQISLDYKSYKNWQLIRMYKESVLLKDYLTSIDIAAELLKRKKDEPKFKLYYGKALYLSKQWNISYDFLRSDFDLHPFENGEIAFYLAELEKVKGNYTEAIDILKKLRSKTKRLKMGDVSRDRIDNSIFGCELALRLSDTVVYTKIDPLRIDFNEQMIEFAPYLISNTELIYGGVTSDDLIEKLNSPYESKRGFCYVVKNETDVWNKKTDLPQPYFNFDDFDTGDGALSVDGLRFYFTKCNRDKNNKYICHLYMSENRNGIWSSPELLNKNINKQGYSATQPTVGTCYDPSLEVVYFVSDRKGGAGGSDIWYAIYDKKLKKHTGVYNAGAFINTSGNEITPFYELESHGLFFSSDFHPTIGGYDIFYAKGELVNWQDPLNVGYPINSPYDDMDYYRNESGSEGVFCSNRLTYLQANKEVYLNRIFGFTETEVARVFVSGKIKTQKLLTSEGIPIMAEENSTNGVLSNQVISISQVADTTASFLIKETFTNENGEFGVWLDKGNDYRIEVKDTLVVGGGFTFNTKDENVKDVLSLDLKPVLTIPTQPIEIKNINYEFDKIALTSEAKAALDSTLLTLIEKYAEIRIRIISHTDNVGSERYNLRLSEKRAENVVKYLVEKGINPERLEAVGKGESDPIAPNEKADGADNPEGRKKNRRTEFEVVGLR